MAFYFLINGEILASDSASDFILQKKKTTRDNTTAGIIAIFNDRVEDS